MIGLNPADDRYRALLAVQIEEDCFHPPRFVHWLVQKQADTPLDR